MRGSFLKRFFVSFGIGLVVALLSFTSRNLWQEGNIERVYRLLSDGFFLAAVLLLGVGALVLVSSTGFFTILDYGMRSAMRLFSFRKSLRLEKSYFDFRREKIAKGRPPMGPVLASGCVHLLLALIAMFLFTQVST